ncbi:microtubule-associated tumor suppressor 1 homolog isoform X2 [Erpetoichthys calabaricus]|uniref:microtubule-associated tumor suppressor 1 homolog isoform X2 n=1 Tax=Erpetoichthys calabaricus TaxID=27687 RepID=UPI0010A04F0B|nr:microtubule-associated tumor suppressor 1 homolog isoform X2 [Erpetoichthys calabaricus]
MFKPYTTNKMSVCKIKQKPYKRVSIEREEEEDTCIQMPLVIGDKNGNEISHNSKSLSSQHNTGNVYHDNIIKNEIEKHDSNIKIKSAGSFSVDQYKEAGSVYREEKTSMDEYNKNFSVDHCIQEYENGNNNCSVDVSPNNEGMDWDISCDANKSIVCEFPQQSLENLFIEKMSPVSDSVSSNEEMRKNSFISGSELQHGLTESCTVDSTSSIHSERGQLSNTMPDVCSISINKILPGLMNDINAEVQNLKDEGSMHSGCFLEDAIDIPEHVDCSPRGILSNAASVCKRHVQASLNCSRKNTVANSLCNLDDKFKILPTKGSMNGNHSVTAPQANLNGCLPLEVISPIEGEGVMPMEGTFSISSPEDICSEFAQASTPVASSKNATFIVPVYEDIVKQNTEDVRNYLSAEINSVRNPIYSLKGKTITSDLNIKKSPCQVPSKHAKVEIMKYPKPDFTNIKPKVISRPGSSLKTINSLQRKTSPRLPSSPSKSSSPRSLKKEEGTGKNEKDTKHNTVSLKKQKQDSGIQYFPGRMASITLNSHAGKVQKPIVDLKRKKGALDKGSCSNSTSSLSSETAATGTQQKLNGASQKDDKTKSTVKAAPLSSTDRPECDEMLNFDNGEGICTVVNGTASGVAMRDVPNILGTISAKLLASPDVSKARFGQMPSLIKPKNTADLRAPAANLRLPPPVPKLKLETLNKNGHAARIVSPSKIKQMSRLGSEKMHISPRERTNPETASSNSGSSSARSTTGSKLPFKSTRLEKTPSLSSLLSSQSDPSSGTFSTKSTATSSKTGEKCTQPALRNISNPVRKYSAENEMRNKASVTSQSSLSGNKPPAVQNQLLSGSSSRTSLKQKGLPLKKHIPVDKNKSKASPRSQQSNTSTQPDLLPNETKTLGLAHYKTQCEKKNECIRHLKKLIINSQNGFEAITVVVQHLLSEREVVLARNKELSLELLNLRGELVNTASSYDRVEKEKDELRSTYEVLLQKVQDQHRSELAHLEDRLKQFYSAEWEKAQEAYKIEVDKMRMEMEKQVEEINSQEQALRKQLENTHLNNTQLLKEHYETSLEELKNSLDQEKNTLSELFQEKESSLLKKIEDITSLNSRLNEKIKAEEERRKVLREKCQKDSHTLYLEQELESLKAVLDMKNEQLHQMDKRLMQLDKLIERNNKLDESLKKIQQENEDLTARMDKHAALSRQLSTEQAVLQESLQKESKVNKRLSMENEELLWKLHNGDVSSPRKLSPSSPSTSLQSPRNSTVFSSPAVSPR